MCNRIQHLKTSLIIFVFSFVLVLASASLYAAEELTLGETENLALNYDPITKGLAARAEGLAEQAIADGQLPDPKLKLGLMNFPTDTFDRGQEAMTQLQIGVQQMIPPGKTLQYQRERTEALSNVEKARGRERILQVLREVRIRYLELYYQVTSEKILQKNRNLFSELLTVTERQYAAGRNNQHDVLRAQLELSLVDDRILEVVSMKETAIAELGKYIAMEQADRGIVEEFPELDAVLPLAQIKQRVIDHPLVRAEDAAVEASRKQISEVEQQYKPAFNIDVTYGERTGIGFDGSGRPDMLSAMLMIDMPLFTDKRQDRRLVAAKKQSLARQFNRTDKLYELASMADREYANWQRLKERLQLYEQRAVVDARHNAESTLKAYQNDVTDFTTLMRAQLTELDTKLDMLRIRVEREKVRARLLYLTGETS